MLSFHLHVVPVTHTNTRIHIFQALKACCRGEQSQFAWGDIHIHPVVNDSRTVYIEFDVQETADNLQAIIGAGLQQFTGGGGSMGPEAAPPEVPEPDEIEKLLQVAIGKGETRSRS